LKAIGRRRRRRRRRRRSVLMLLLGNDKNEVVFFFWSVPRLLPEEGKSAVLCFQEDPSKAAIYWTSQPELQTDEAVKRRPA
jgi:hypothetical protein